MKITILEKFRKTLNSQRDFLIKWISNTDQEKTQLCLGPDCSTACKDKVNVIEQIDKTLEKIDNNNFGKCCICNEEVEPELLELDYTKEVCLEHFTEDEKRQLERDLEMASKVQRQLLPSQIPSINGYQLAVHSQSAGIVGGDYFDFFSKSENTQGFIIADVMGKGLPASMLMANLQASLRILGSEYDAMDKLAERINELFRYNSKLISFISLFLGQIDITTGIFEYCNAGHNPPLLINSANQNTHLLNPTGPAVGLMQNPKYSTGKISLNKGDMLLLYTDGLIEARNGNMEEFGKERMLKLVEKYSDKNAEEFLGVMKKELKSFTGGNSHDDITLLVIKKI